MTPSDRSTIQVRGARENNLKDVSLVDMRAGAGADGGTVVFEGTPHDLVSSGTTTGESLRAHLG